MKLRLFQLFVIITTYASALYATDKGLIEVSAQVDTSVITIGDRITYSIIIDRQEDLRIARPGEGLNLGMFEIKDYHFPEPVRQKGRVIEQFDFSISVYDTGKYSIPPFPVAYFTDQSDTNFSIIEAPAVDIYVKSVLTGEDAAELRDVKDPLSVPFDYWFWIWVTASAILLVLSTWVVFYLIKKRREKGYLFTPPAPPRPAHEVALEALAELYDSDLLDQKAYKAFFSKLSEILRIYLEGRFYFSALEETSAEILTELKKHLDKEELLLSMNEILSLSDLVKFAKYQPNAEEIKPVKEQAKMFINETKIIFEQPIPAGEDSNQESTLLVNETVEPNQISGGA